MEEFIKKLTSTKGKKSKKIPLSEKTETEEEKKQIMSVHKQAIEYCGKQIREDWIDIQVMSASSLDDIIDSRLSNIDWNNGWFACSKHFMKLCNQMTEYVAPDDGKNLENDEDFYFGINYIERANNAIKRMKAKIEILEFEVKKGKLEDQHPRLFDL